LELVDPRRWLREFWVNHFSLLLLAPLPFLMVPSPKMLWSLMPTRIRSGRARFAREAIAEITGDSGRYSFWLTEDLGKRFAEQQGLKPEYVRAFPGSGEALHFSVLAFTSTSRSYVTADPGYEAGMHAAKISGARVVKTPLSSSYAHHVKAMIGAAPDAGLFMFARRIIRPAR
jgi:histidinol-phosphate/aromatic aminotransferase/cobyric acid decarboxylase-like protein